MGVTGGLVRSIFFRNKSFRTHDYNNNNGRSNHHLGGEKKRWSSSVRSYLCGDEFNSVLAVDDSGSIKDSEAFITMSKHMCSDLVVPSDSVQAIQGSASVKHSEEDEEDSVSVKSSEATVTQPLLSRSQETETNIAKMHQADPISKLFVEEEAAAIIIQSTFRSYLATRRRKEVEARFDKEESISGEESQGNVSMGTSLDVQTCDSLKAPVFSRKRRVLQKNKTQVLRMKEDWDDSTVSTTIAKSRTQSRIEAMTKRERALAYAFSQQLRICTKKKQIDRSGELEDEEANIGWSWLERWMATRAPDNILTEPRTNIHTDFATNNQRLVRKNRSFGLAGELEESCASNDIPLQFENISETKEDETNREKSGFKASLPKRKSFPSYKSQKTHNRLQATKRDSQQQTKKAKKAKTLPGSCNTGNECDETSQKLSSST